MLLHHILTYKSSSIICREALTLTVQDKKIKVIKQNKENK